MTTRTIPGNPLDALPAPVERKALGPAATAPRLPRFDAPESRAGWPAEDHLPDEKEDDEC